MILTGLATVAGSAPGLLLPLAISQGVRSRPLTDAYFFAVDTTLFSATIFAIVLRSVVVPFILEWSEDSHPRLARSMVARVACQAAAGATVLFMVTAALVVFLVLPNTSFTPAQQVETSKFLLYLLPLPGTMAWAAVLAGAYYAKNRWVFAAWSEGFRGVLPLVALLVLKTDLSVVAASLFLGELVRVCVLQFGWARLEPLREGVAKSRPPPGALPRFWRVARPHLLSMLVINSNPFIDRLFCSALPAGSVTTFVISEKLFYVPQLLLATAVATVYGTRWAQAAVSSDFDPVRLLDDFRVAQRRITGSGVAMAIVLTVAALVFAPLLAGFLHVDRTMFVPTLGVFCMGLPAALSSALSLRLFLAMKQTRVLVVFAVILVVVNTIGDVLGALLFGVVGIAISSTLVRTVGAFGFWLWTPRVLGLLGPSARATRSGS